MLDSGCGTGVLGFIVARFLASVEKIASAEFTFVDNNPTAIDCTKFNAQKMLGEHRAARARYEVAHVYPLAREVNDQFEIIVCNPPHIPDHSYKQLHGVDISSYDHKEHFLQDLLAHAPERLAPGGYLLLIYSDIAARLGLQGALDFLFCVNSRD